MENGNNHSGKSSIAKNVFNLMEGLLAAYWGFGIITGEKSVVGGVVFLVIGVLFLVFSIFYVKEMFHKVPIWGQESEAVTIKPKQIFNASLLVIAFVAFSFGGYSLIVGQNSPIGYIVIAFALWLIYLIIKKLVKKIQG